MKLKIGPDIDNNSVRLDYVKTPGRPINMPSYIIDKNSADVFVKKYNEISEISSLKSLFFTLFGSMMGLGIASKRHTHKFLHITTGISSGAIAGLVTSMITIRNEKNKLMNKYKVLEI